MKKEGSILTHSLSETNVLNKLNILKEHPKIPEYLNQDEHVSSFLKNADSKSQLIIHSLIAIGEGPIVFRGLDKLEKPQQALHDLVQVLLPVEKFYDTIGGIIGYYLTVMRLILGNHEQKEKIQLFKPEGIDITKDNREVRQIVRWGIEALPEMAEIYSIGGTGDRLNLRDEKSGEALPAAKLAFTGKTLLEGLIRDLEAREYLYYKLFGEKIITPIAMMTSHDKNNHNRIYAICEELGWFGRPKESFFFFIQPLVPVITQEGHWSLLGPLQLTLKPGGHGVIWKLALDHGVFDWLRSHHRTNALVRQINNPISGTDHGLLALTGYGWKKNKAFGFASCPRILNTAQGMNVLVEKEVKEGFEYRITNIEYTEFKKLGIKDEPEAQGSFYSKFPANTNILFVDLETVKDAVKHCPIPGMLINMKTKSPYIDKQGRIKHVRAGRLESTMQNIADEIVDITNHHLDQSERTQLRTFLTYNQQRKTISVTKRSYSPDKPLRETPEGCYYELMHNYRELLADNCGMQVPEICEEEGFLKTGPNIHILMHPALGPLYSIIGQKIQGGTLVEGSELQCEIAELELRDLYLDGSLIISSIDLTGKCVLKNVKVENRGIDRKAHNIYWKNQIKRHEALKIILHSNAEFVAENMTISSDQLMEVPENHRMIAYEEGKSVKYRLEKIQQPTWQWRYSFDQESRIILNKSK